MKGIVKKILTWLFSGFNLGMWCDKPTELDTLLNKLDKFNMLEQSYRIQLVYHELVINEIIQSFLMFLSLCLLFVAHIDRVWTIVDKLRTKYESFRNQKK